MIVIQKVAFLPRFEKDYQRLPPDIREHTKVAINQLLERKSPPFPKTLKFEKLNGYRNPNVFTIHVTHNHSHKASFEMRGDVAYFRQIGTHKELDRAP